LWAARQGLVRLDRPPEPYKRKIAKDEHESAKARAAEIAAIDEFLDALRKWHRPGCGELAIASENRPSLRLVPGTVPVGYGSPALACAEN
ncbi:MAG TPA: hypothetical protein VM434_04535, partial [Beijerinckiaceae bacterium]|nr:hypothetical protein [Beijerinckiaceae bacterium]